MALRAPQTVLVVTVLVAAARAVAAEPIPLSGERLIVETGHVGAHALEVESRDAGLALGRANGSPDDPVKQGGTVRLVSTTGDFFDATYALPARGWHYVGRKGENRGYRFRRAAAAVRSVVIRSGKLLRLEVKGRDLQSLSADPDFLAVVLTLGAQTYCLDFHGATTVRNGRRLIASGARPPVVCPLPYGDDSLWLCRPGMARNQCLMNSLDATAVRPDGSTVLEPHGGAGEDQPYDCFYVYPTVDISGVVGNHTDFSDVGPMLDPLLSQAAPFNASCRIFAPLYRQVTLATYHLSNAGPYVDVAYGDVEAAFRRYLARDNGGRNFVLMGHSQGTQLLARLIQDVIDDVSTLRARLIVALLIGGNIVVPEGHLVGGTFNHLPLCTAAAQTGCVIAYRSYAEGYPPTGGSNVEGGEGMDTACTNPAALAGGEGRFAEAYFVNVLRQPALQLFPDPGYPTPFTEYPDFYAGQCVEDDHHRSYLEIRVRPAPGDVRTNPVPFGRLSDPDFPGTHLLDYSFALGDLIRLVQTKAAAMP